MILRRLFFIFFLENTEIGPLLVKNTEMGFSLVKNTEIEIAKIRPPFVFETGFLIGFKKNWTNRGLSVLLPLV